MRRFAWICLTALLIVATVLALQRDLLPVYFNFFGINCEVKIPIDLGEERFSEAGGGEEESAGAPAVSLKNLARQITAGAADEYEKLCAVYDWITANIAYDVEKAKDMENYGAGAAYLLKERKGVCHDYAELTRALLKAVGIKATYEKGEIHPAAGRTERHAWNHACIGETCYGLDTTWGAGFVDEESGVFVQRPSRLYLTTPEELARLHRDPAYKESCEMELRRAAAVAEKPVYIPEYEDRLLALINEARVSKGLAPFAEEARLVDEARQSSAAAAEEACGGLEHTHDSLRSELERRASELRLAKAGMYTFSLWDYPLPPVEKLYSLIAAEEETYMHEAGFQALAAAVIRRGELIVVTLVFLSYY